MMTIMNFVYIVWKLSFCQNFKLESIRNSDICFLDILRQLTSFFPDLSKLWIVCVRSLLIGGQFSPSVWPHNPAAWFRPPSATVVSAEPFSHGTGTLRCLQKEMATYRHWSVSLWRDQDDVSHCRILSPDKTEWRLISTTLCRWRRCFVADQLWFMTHIREEEEEEYFIVNSLCKIAADLWWSSKWWQDSLCCSRGKVNIVSANENQIRIKCWFYQRCIMNYFSQCTKNLCERNRWYAVNCRHFLAWCKWHRFGGHCSTTQKEPNFSTSL